MLGVYAPSAIDLDSRALGDAHLLPVGQHLESDPGRLAVPRIGQRQIRQVDRRLLGNDAAVLGRRLTLVTLDDVHAAHQRAIPLAHNLDDLAAAALVAAGEHDHLVSLADLGRHYSTSGASEMIFMWFLARNSRGTGPKAPMPPDSPS